MLETHADLRQTKQRLARQESQNKEYSQSTKHILPGTYHEDEAEEEMKMIVPTKYKDKNTKRDETFEETESKEKENIKSMEYNLDERLSIMDKGIENDYKEEVGGDQEVEKQEQEQGPSTEAL
ncbi:hypothetical protein O181_063642 [Austropuccinia psidii MF-1]|uniref:Uncharacterized protein n=1 Tax=Austropuccinia psidii MF-1 TaxID=1389203 RepID=A0A9Q3EQ05_9BASI|nr:hypothetical protein [Austropuccinia psidii MF-1]